MADVPELSGRVRLRRFVTGDVGNLVELDSDPEVIRYLFRKPPDRYAVQAALAGILAGYERHPGFGQWAAELVESEEFIGWFSLHASTPDTLRCPELGYRLRRRHWGQGLAGAASVQLVEWAFLVRGVDAVRAQTMAVNIASRRVMAKAGLRHVRTFHLDFDDPLPGTEAGEVEYAISRAEWLRQREGAFRR
ncbi:MAG: GNAT family N-acetyltransferase [Jatrophihabitans sp.]